MNYFQMTVLNEAMAARTEDDYGIEGFSSIFDFFSDFVGNIRRIFKTLLNNNVMAMDKAPTVLKGVEKKLKSHTWADFSELEAYRPDHLNVAMVDYVTIVAEQSEAIQTIIDRLYDPTISWLAKAASQPDFQEKLWVDKELQLLDIEAMRKRMAKCFKQDSKQPAPDRAPLMEMYGSEKQLVATYEKLDKIFDIYGQFDLEKLQAKEEELLRHINYYIEARANGDVTLSKANARKLADVFRAIGTETEYLSALTYVSRVAITAFNDTVTNIEEF